MQGKESSNSVFKLSQDLAPKSTPEFAVQLNGISKRFGTVQANRNVDLFVQAGQIHGIVGENGSGKSTLMNILYGFHAADSGTIQIFGDKIPTGRPAEALAHGLGMVHQHFMLIDSFTVVENVMLGSEGGLLLKQGKKRTRDLLADFGTTYGLTLPVDTKVGDLPVGLKQRVEIIKALKGGTRVLILDEPTSVLTPQEAEGLFQILRTLRAEGITVLLITHKLAEIMAITDRVSVMRQGEKVADLVTSQTCQENLAELMVGRQVKKVARGAPVQTAEVQLKVCELSYTNTSNRTLLNNINFSVHSGEILGVAGISGNGQSELLDILCGLLTPSAGSVHVSGVEINAQTPCTPADIRALAVGHVPEDRHRRGMVLPFTAFENAVLGYHNPNQSSPNELHNRPLYPDIGSRPFLSPTRMKAHCQDLMDRWDIRSPNPLLVGQHFSGGNQQKLVMARETEAQPKVLLVGQPTRGVDIGAIEYIHQHLMRLRGEGCALLLVSVELEEILALSDRVLVLHEGRQMGLMMREEIDEQSLGLMMAGVTS